MALDRIIRFDSGAPSPESVEGVLVNFVGKAGTVKKSHHPELHYWVVTLQGKISFALKNETGNLFSDEKERWIEVFLHPPKDFYDHVKIDVLTRHTDDFTHAIADGIVSVLQRHWNGTRGEL